MKLKRYCYAGLASLMLLGAFSGCGSGNVSDNSKEESTRDAENIEGDSDDGGFDENSKETKKKTAEIEKYIDNLYYFDIDDEKREESYYDGIMNGLDDRYSVYYTKEEYDKMMEDDSGSFEGIGATVSKSLEDGTIYIVKPLEDSPAEKSGLLPGDVILRVDDMELTTDMELDYVVQHIRGEKGTDVEIEVYREGEPDFLTFTVTRDTIETKTVAYEMLDNDIGYIQVEQFIENTPSLFKDAVDDLQSQGAKAIVFDFRSNPGGLVKAAVEMLDYLIEDDALADGAETKGLLLQTKDKDGNVLENYKCEDGHSVDLPMALIIDNNSASSSEIFAGAFQDYNLGKVVGMTSYGKGIVQSVIKLSDGSAIKLTIAQYFRPSGEVVHEVGIEPDIEEELDDDLKKKITIEHDEDNQLQKAIETLD
ncbi:carboxyl-terminal processing protease [Lachnospiraceae bacterium NE2001]|nr:carboxyl-terminal processing protease [Lachnospiraceae bacterium NE2001]